MSAPALSRRPRPGPALPVDEEEMRRWVLWLIARGYAESTARLWASKIRTAYAHGIGSPDAVGDEFLNWSSPLRSSLRQALRELDAFRRAGR